MRILYLFSLFLLLACCTQTPYRGKEVLGAEEFVLDSYKIREGKAAILEMEGRFNQTLSPELLEEYPDVIVDGDILAISIYHPRREDLMRSFEQLQAVNAFKVVEGKIFLPDLGSVEIGGLTLQQAKQKLEKQCANQISDLQFFVSYKSRENRKVELVGLVNLSEMPVDGKLRIYEALARARIASNANLYKSYVLRQGQLLLVDLHKLLKEGDMSQNIVLHSGDKIFIAEPSASIATIMGEVGRSRVIELPNGFMSLRQVLAEAGGLTFNSDRRYIQIFRGSAFCPKIYTLHWQHVVTLPTDSLLIMPGDMVYVAATPISEWSRFVNQILPTLIGIDLLTRGVKSIGVNIP